MPVNMRTHAHGQGYADLNWLMPETVNSLDIRKGPYFADEGDFASAGNLHINLIDRPEKNIAQATLGSFGYQRYFGMGATKWGNGTLLAAGEAGAYNGPWVNPDDMRKLNGLVRYSEGTAANGLSVTAMAYSNKWNSTDQVPERAITRGDIDRFGAEDASDGGNTNRFSLSARMAGTDALGSWKANAYAIKSKLDLYNNFTYFLSDPVLGDQFHQHDDRLVTGGHASRTFNGTFGGLAQRDDVRRADPIRQHQPRPDRHVQRAFLSNVRSDKVGEGSVGVYAQNTMHWTDWFRTTAGCAAISTRRPSTRSSIRTIPGDSSAALASPKFTAVLGPFHKTELFVGCRLRHAQQRRARRHHHRDAGRSDRRSVRGVGPVAEIAAAGPHQGRRGGHPHQDRSGPQLVGQPVHPRPGLGAGLQRRRRRHRASRRSRRVGVEWTNSYRPVSWLAFDADLAVSRARFIGFDNDQAALFASLAGFPEAQIGNAPGPYIPNAPAIVASAGITLGEKTGWFGALRWRYLGASPLTEDNAFRSPPTSIVNGRVGYRFENGWRVQLDALNMLDSKTNQITYAYGSLIKTDNLFAACLSAAPPPAAVCQTGVMDRVLHPIEPLAVRLTVTAAF